MRKTAALMLAIALPLSALGAEHILGLGGIFAPPVEVGGEKALVFIPRFVAGADLGSFLVLGEFWGELEKEEGAWPHQLRLDVALGLYFKWFNLSYVYAFSGLFAQPSLVMTGLGGSQFTLSAQAVVGVRLVGVAVNPPYSLFAFTIDLHPLGILTGFVAGVRF